MDYIERIKIVRKDKKETQAQTAEVLNLIQQQYSRYESGKNELPIRYLVELCKHWNISADYILGLIDIPRELKTVEK